MDPKITLYSFADFDRSSRVRWLLHELGLTYTDKRIKSGENRSDEFLAINPLAKIPCIEINGNTIFESGAIFTYLLQKFQDHNLVPKNEVEYQQYLSWFFYICGEVDVALGKVISKYLFRCGDTEINTALEQAKPMLDALENRLQGTVYLIGNSFTACDIFLGSQLGLMHKAGLLSNYPNLLLYVTAHQSRAEAVQAKVFTSQVVMLA